MNRTGTKKGNKCHSIATIAPYFRIRVEVVNLEGKVQMLVCKVTYKTNYGNEAIYPVCNTAKGFAEIAGTKTLTRQTLATIVKMGYEIDVETPPIFK